MVLGVHRDGAEADTAPPEEAGEAEAPIVPEGALVETAPLPVDAPEVGQTGGGATEASPTDSVTARTLELELPASSAIGGSVPEGAPVMEEVPSAPVGPTPMVATADPSVGARPSRSLVWPGDDSLTWGRNRPVGRATNSSNLYMRPVRKHDMELLRPFAVDGL